MAHFCQLDENNIVTRVIVVDNGDIKDVNGTEVEEIGVSFCKKLFGADTNWKQTSYNNNMRVRYASIGFSYNEELDAFIAPKPYPSWVLNNETTNWEAPIAQPELTQEQLDADSHYEWDEENTTWNLVTPE